MNLTKHLNSQQIKAALHCSGPLLILAGAGSGKTRVIIYRIANLISNLGIRPYNILAITFTNKAAKEMKDRLYSLLGKNSIGVWVSTFHSFCLRILRQHIEKIGYHKDFVIYGPAEQTIIIKDCIKKLNVDIEIYTPKSCLWKISTFKNELTNVEDLKAGKKNFSFLNKEIIDIYDTYQKGLRDNNALDFDDLIMLTVKLLAKNPVVSEYYSNMFRFIMVDEYQDTNHAQYSLIKNLYYGSKDTNICVVGDDDQSIYRWRGADIDNIFNFEKDYPGTDIIRLEENYRSVQTILDASNSVIQKNFRRKGKRLWTKNNKGEKLEYHRLANEASEANFVIEKIKNLSSINSNYSDIAIFYRTNAQSRIIEDYLVRANIPYQVIGGLKFYERKEIKDILAYLKVFVNPVDSISLKRIINVPKRGIGKTTINKIIDYSISKNLSFLNSIKQMSKAGLFKGTSAKRLNIFLELIENLSKNTTDTPVSTVLTELIEKTQFLENLKIQKDIQTDERINNIKELITAAKNFEENGEDISVKGFLDNASLVTSVDSFDNNKGLVTLMTFHASKGLEFSVVFMVGMENNLFPHRSAFDDIAEMEEERRLCYVGMTRAKDRLFLLNVIRRRIYNNEQYNRPSIFIDDISPELINL